MKHLLQAKNLLPVALILLPTATPASSAEGPSGGVWRFGAREEHFALKQMKGIPFQIRVSEACVHGGSAGALKAERDCDAWAALRRAADPEFRKSHSARIPASRGGSEPGSRICRWVYGASVTLADDRRGNRNAFCTFEDGSRVSTGSLSSVWEHAPDPASRER